MPHSANRLLAAFGEGLILAQPHLKLVSIRAGDVLADTGERVEHAYFLHGGLVSMMIPLEDGSLTAACVIGREGVVGGLCALGLGTSLTRDIAYCDAQAYALEAERLYDLTHRSQSIHDAMENYLLGIIGQGTRNTACNVRHSTEGRVARWLLTLGAMLESHEIRLSQTGLADIIGVQRTSVNPVLQRFKALKLVEVERNRVILLDRAGLKRRSCECYSALRPILITALRPDVAAASPERALRKLKRASCG